MRSLTTINERGHDMNSMAEEIKYAFYLTVHPFKGFWEIKHENKGSVRTASVILILFIITSIADGFYCGFLFNSGGGISYNMAQGLAVILLSYFIWCISNWCLTSLFDGEGSFKDICKATAYSLLPISVVQMILIPLSLSLTLDESSFFKMILYIGIIWTAFLLFIGIIVTHQYTFLKSIVIVLFTLLGMCIITYILLLFFNLIQQMIGFVITFWKEFSLRIS